MADEDILNAGSEKELNSLEILLAAKVGRTALTLEEYVQLRVSQGASLEQIRADLLKDLEEGGRIFGEFRNAIKPTFAGSISRFRDVGQVAENGIGELFRWAAILVNTCPDCLDRHGIVQSWDDWEQLGLPRSGATVCRDHCKCVLMPADSTELSPIYRSKN